MFEREFLGTKGERLSIIYKISVELVLIGYGSTPVCTILQKSLFSKTSFQPRILTIKIFYTNPKFFPIFLTTQINDSIDPVVFSIIK